MQIGQFVDHLSLLIRLEGSVLRELAFAQLQRTGTVIRGPLGPSLDRLERQERFGRSLGCLWRGAQQRMPHISIFKKWVGDFWFSTCINFSFLHFKHVWTSLLPCVFRMFSENPWQTQLSFRRWVPTRAPVTASVRPSRKEHRLRIKMNIIWTSTTSIHVHQL